MKFECGCAIEPHDDRDYSYELISGSTISDLAEYEVKTDWHFYQNGQPSCCANAMALAKSQQEGKKLSPRFLWGNAKEYQNYSGYGTYPSIVLKQLVDKGALEYDVLDENVKVSRYKYMRFDLDEKEKKEARKNRALSYWYVDNLMSLKIALYESRIPIPTSMYWYSAYNTPKAGFLPPKPSGESVGGHMFAFKGWKRDKHDKEYLVFQNSWAQDWGDNGDFYVYSKDFHKYGFRRFYIITDIPQDRAIILNKYQKQLIKNADSPKVYFVLRDKIAWIENSANFEFGMGKLWGGWDDIKTIENPIKEDLIL